MLLLAGPYQAVDAGGLQQGLQLAPSCHALLGGVRFTKYIFSSGTQVGLQTPKTPLDTALTWLFILALTGASTVGFLLLSNFPSKVNGILKLYGFVYSIYILIRDGCPFSPFPAHLHLQIHMPTSSYPIYVFLTYICVCISRDIHGLQLVSSEVKIATGTARLTCNVTGHVGGIPILPSRTASAHVLDGKEAIFPFGLNVWQGSWITTSIVGYLRCVTVIYCYV